MKPILCFCLCILSASAFCQVKVGVQAGYNLTTLSGKKTLSDFEYDYHTYLRSAFNAGVIASVPLFKRASLQPSLLLSEKGTEETTSAWELHHHSQFRLYYAHLPVQVMYTFINRKQLQVSAGAGGFVSYGIWGTAKGYYSSKADTTGLLKTNSDYSINFTNHLYRYEPNSINVRSWDVGFTTAVAAIWQRWQLKAACDFGTVKISGPGSKNTEVFSLSAGYYFSTKKR